jgi:hypothetical protein
MSDEKIIPFRRRPPSQEELHMYRQITRNWDPALKRLMFPEHSKHDPQTAEAQPSAE